MLAFEQSPCVDREAEVHRSASNARRCPLVWEYLSLGVVLAVGMSGLQPQIAQNQPEHPENGSHWQVKHLRSPAAGVFAATVVPGGGRDLGVAGELLDGGEVHSQVEQVRDVRAT